MYNNKYRSRNKEQKIKIIKTYNSYNMKQSNFTKLSTLLLAIVLTISANQLFAQTTNGIFFQAVARDNFSNPAKDRKIFVQTSIIQTTVTGTKVLTEEHQANTDATGVFSVSIGNGTRVGGTAANLNGIDWSTVERGRSLGSKKCTWLLER